jgi:hypothetical protein
MDVPVGAHRVPGWDAALLDVTDEALDGGELRIEVPEVVAVDRRVVVIHVLLPS